MGLVMAPQVFHWFISMTAPSPTNWVSGATSGTELGINAPSGFTGNFLDLHVNGGNSVAYINSSGTFSTSAGILGTSSNTNFYSTSVQGIGSQQNIAGLQFAGSTENQVRTWGINGTTSISPNGCRKLQRIHRRRTACDDASIGHEPHGSPMPSSTASAPSPPVVLRSRTRHHCMSARDRRPELNNYGLYNAGTLYSAGAVTSAVSTTSPIIYGGTATGSTLTLQGTSNGSPSSAYVLLNPSGGGGVRHRDDVARGVLDIGSAGATLGTMRLEGSSSGYVQIQPATAAGAGR